MNVSVIGTGGREQAIAWACRRFGHDVAMVSDVSEVAAVDLVIVGPESALAAGAADECIRRGIPCFGPIAALARLESSKSYTRQLAMALGLPSPASMTTDDAAEAITWWRQLGRPVVVKLDGLAAGKGVIVPSTAAETEAAIAGLSARGTIVVEERFSGPECSLMALCDGRIAVPLPLAQDHKRLGVGDTGPNTGGMGAYAPAPVPFSADELTAMFIQPVVDHLAAAGTPYVGVLYAGLMLTTDGPKLLEFNCRFGDPEAQVVLPLIDSDLAELAMACVNGRLSHTSVVVSSGAACAVVAAAPGYPALPVLGAAITGLPSSTSVLGGDDGEIRHDGHPEPNGSLVFEAAVANSCVAGGRVLAVTGLGADLAEARRLAYERMSTISFAGMQVRGDVAWRAPGAQLTSYAAAGVDIDEGTRAVQQMKDAVERTHGPAVLRGVGSFGGAFSAAALKQMDDPVLVGSTDGVGTKVELAARLGRYRGVGHDIVNHCIGDVLVQAARPLFFLDYVASSKLDADQVAEVVTGIAEACEASGCALLGGETAEMPGVYVEGAFDIAGTLVGLVERAALLPRDDVAPGDVLIGVASSGPHTNGYSLLRKVFQWLPMDSTPAEFDRPLGDTLLEPHRSYLDVLMPAINGGSVKALAHITGGGLPENLPRVLPDGCDAVIRLGSWPQAPLWTTLAGLVTGMDTTELYRTVNMGIGMVVVCAASEAAAVRDLIAEPTWVIGELTAGSRKVHLR